jgi:hypothetical protein
LLKDSAGAIVSFDGRNPLRGHDQGGYALFSRDILTSKQYYTAPVASPYHRLLLAILEDAIRCFRRNLATRNGPRRILFRETEEWLFDSDDIAFLSCPMVCESLGINPVQLRRYLLKWRVREKAGNNAPRLARHDPVTADFPSISPNVIARRRRPTPPRRCRGAGKRGSFGPETSGADAHLR